MSVLELRVEDLERLGERHDAPSILEQLVTRLILSTGEDVALGASSPHSAGFSVRAAKDSRYLRAGLSHWELLTSQSTPSHAAGVDAGADVVWVCPRRVSASDRSGLTKHDGVRVLDAGDVVGWIREAPAVAVWVLELEGRPLEHLRTLDAHAASWMARTVPALPLTILTLGAERQRLATSLRDALANSLNRNTSRERISLVADDVDEAVSFAAAALLDEDAARSVPFWASRTLIATSEVGARSVGDRDGKQSSLVVVTESLPELPTRGVQHVAARARAGGGPDRNSLELDPIPYLLLPEVLARAGWRQDEADRIANASGGKLSALQRLCGYHRVPQWVERHGQKELLALLLAGAFEVRNDADMSVLSALGADPGAASLVWRELTTVADAPAVVDHEVYRAHVWRWQSHADAWQLLAPRLIEIDSFVREAVRVLSVVDPLSAGSAEGRFLASMRKDRVRESEALREGLATSTARLSQSDDLLRRALGASAGSDAAVRIVSQVLRSASVARWASLNRLLPVMAEAAPTAFLEALEASLSDDEGAGAIFTLERSASTPHTGLLWALETLGWHEQLLTRVTLALASLLERDQSGERAGRVANRPIASLTLLLHPIIPHTMAPVRTRLAALRHVVDRHPSVAMDLLIRLLGSAFGGGMLLPSRSPSFVAWPTLTFDELKARGDAEWREFVKGTVDLTLDAASDSASDWARVIHALIGVVGLEEPVLERASRQRFLDPTLKFWEALRAELYRDAVMKRDRSRPAHVMLRRLYEQYAPEDPIDRVAWLFKVGVQLPEVEHVEWREQERLADAQRDSAITSLLAGGSDDVWTTVGRLAARVPDVDLLGFRLGHSQLAKLLEDRLLREGGGAPPFDALLPAFAVARFTLKGSAWLADAIRQLVLVHRSEAALQVLLRIPPSREIWDTLRSASPELESDYWHRLERVFGNLSPADRAHVIKQQLSADNVIGAFRTLTAAEAEPQDILRVLERLASEPDTQAALRTDTIAGYHISTLLEKLSAAGIDSRELAQLEIRLLGLLDLHHPPRHLGAVFGDDPETFVDLVKLMYRPKGEPAQEDQSEERAKRATVAWEILNAWRGYPGEEMPSAEREATLYEWCRTALRRLAAEGRIEVGTIEVARVLARSPAADDGHWPSLAARRLLEERAGRDLASSIEIAKHNLRGAHSRALGAGGDQERAIAARFSASAESLRDEWPFTASMLDSMARYYERDAAAIDESARALRRREGLDRPAPPEVTMPKPKRELPKELEENVNLPITLHAENYRVLRRSTLRIESGIQVVIGANGVGKTSLFRALGLIRDSMRHGTAYALNRDQGQEHVRNWNAEPAEPLVLGVSSGKVNWEFHVDATPGAPVPFWQERVVDSETVVLRREPNSEAFTHTTSGQSEESRSEGFRLAFQTLVDRKQAPSTWARISTRLLSFQAFGEYDFASLRSHGSNVTESVGLAANGRNVFAVLRSWQDAVRTRERFQFVVTSLAAAFPGVLTDVEFESAGSTLALKFVGKRSFSSVYAANGLLQGLIHLVAVANTERGGIVGLDEFENSLHPYAIQSLLRSIGDWAVNNELSVILTTHSPVVLNAFRTTPSRLMVMERGQSPIPVPLDQLEDPEWLRQFVLGELFEAGEFGAPLARDPEQTEAKGGSPVH